VTGAVAALLPIEMTWVTGAVAALLPIRATQIRNE
jgi:hypothetical protein